jgi:hypothetical protein
LTKQAGALIKQSFERRAKRLGLATSEESAIEAAELDKFKDLSSGFGIEIAIVKNMTVLVVVVASIICFLPYL